MKQKYVIIVGCGRLGRILTNRFSLKGYSIVVIDQNDQTFSLLSPDFSGFTIEGDATELAVLKKAKIEKADVFLAVTNNDNINLMIAQIAKTIFGVGKVLARVNDPKREVIYKGLDVITISPLMLAADRLTNLIEE